MALTEPRADLDRGLSLQAEIPQTVRDHWKACLFEGVGLVALGSVAIAVPQFASIAATVFLGWLFVLTGAVGLATTAWAREACGLWWSVVSAALAIAAGLVLLLWPLQATFSLTVIVGAYFLVEGLTTILFALDHRRERSTRWGLVMAAGIVDILVAMVVVIGLPGSAFWTIGLLIGLNLIFGGGSLIALALAAKQTQSA